MLDAFTVAFLCGLALSKYVPDTQEHLQSWKDFLFWDMHSLYDSMRITEKVFLNEMKRVRFFNWIFYQQVELQL